MNRKEKNTQKVLH